jgi:hypothetical protein
MMITGNDQNTEILNWATIRFYANMFLPPVNENLFSTFRICVPDKISAGYKPAKKLTSTENSSREMIVRLQQVGCTKLLPKYC